MSTKPATLPAPNAAGAMEFTKRFLRAKNPCANGFRWFVRHVEDGASYQEALDTLVQAGRVEDACWLLTQFGPTDAVLTVDAIEAEAIVFSGTLEVRGHIEVSTVVRAGRMIRAGGGIRAGEQIIAGDGIRVGGGIRCDGSLSSGGDVRAEWGIEVQQALSCADDVRAGWDLICGDKLNVGGHIVVGQDLITQGAVTCGKSVRVGGRLTAADSVRAEQGMHARGQSEDAGTDDGIDRQRDHAGAADAADQALVGAGGGGAVARVHAFPRWAVAGPGCSGIGSGQRFGRHGVSLRAEHLHRGGAQWTAVEETLRHRHARLAQHARLLPGLHALGDHLQLGGRQQRGQACQPFRSRLVRTDVGDQAAVDLDDMELAAREHRQVGAVEHHVVQGEAYAAARRLLHLVHADAVGDARSVTSSTSWLRRVWS